MEEAVVSWSKGDFPLILKNLIILHITATAIFYYSILADEHTDKIVISNESSYNYLKKTQKQNKTKQKYHT